MSKASLAYVALQTRLAAVLPGHALLTNPYNPEQNADIHLRKGYGIRLGAAENSRRSNGGIYSLRRSVEVVITRMYFASELNRTAKDATEKSLLEDQYLMLKDVEKEPTLGNSDAVAAFGFQGDNGIEAVFSEDKPYLMIITRFELEYLEDLN